MLKQVWNQLTVVHPSLADIEKKRQSQLLAIIALFIVCFQILSFPFVVGGLYTSGGFITYIIGTVMAITVYLLNRRGHYTVAAYLLVIVAFIAIHLSLISNNYATLFYAASVFIASAIFLSIKATLTLFALSIILQVAFILYTPETYTLSRVDPLFFLIFMAPFIIVFMFHRLGVEKDRQAELRMAINALQESEARWRSLIAAAPHTLSLIDRDYRFDFVNGLPDNVPSEKLTKQVVKDYVHPDYYDLTIQHFEKALSSKTAVRFEAICIDVYGNEEWYALSASAIRNKDVPEQLLVVARNISQEKQAEQSLIEEHNLLRTVIDSIPDSIYIKDTEGHFLLNNRTSLKKLGNVKQEELVGKTDFDLFDTALARQFRENEVQTLASNQSFLNFEEPLIDREKGIVGQVLTSIIAVRNAKGEASHLIGISRDITKQKQLEKQQLELSVHRERLRVLEEVLSDLSHDIKTPLASIKTAVYILQKHPEKRESYLEALDTQVNRLTKLVEDVLAIARLDKKGHFTFSSVSLSSLNRIIEAILSDFAPQIKEKKIKLNLDLYDSDKLIMANDTELGRAIGNLIENAVNYSVQDGSINIETKLEAKRFIIRVSDTGIGIGENDIPHIFDRFYRADKARTTSEGGTGLGLAITQRIIEIHDGKIEVKSELGKGSCFTISLPMLLDA